MLYYKNSLPIQINTNISTKMLQLYFIYVSFKKKNNNIVSALLIIYYYDIIYIWYIGTYISKYKYNV